MKFISIFVLSMGLLSGSEVYSAESPRDAKSDLPASAELMTDEEKINYNLGYGIGRDLKHEKLNMLPDVIMRGIEDGITGKKALVSSRKRGIAIKQLRKTRALGNLEKSRAFLAANGKKEGVQTLPSGLQYREIVAGEGKTPSANDRVEVNYRGTLIDGTEFDDTYKRGRPSTFQVKKAIKGWREALPMMKEGAKWELVVPPDLAYGKRGKPKAIPPNSALIYEVELVSVK